MHVGFVSHNPSAGGDFQTTRVDQRLEGSPLAGMGTFPPGVQEGYFGPDESEVLVLLHFGDHVVEDLTRLRVEVALECLQPSRIVVGMGYNDYLWGKSNFGCV